DDIGGEISGADRFIFGHTAVKRTKTFWNQQYIDTGAVFCGNLTLMKVKGDGAA
ncbi:serine/threonine protein phosphatase, partial [Escherichia coli]